MSQKKIDPQHIRATHAKLDDAIGAMYFQGRYSYKLYLFLIKKCWSWFENFDIISKTNEREMI